MASAQFLEEALSTDVDESAVNALVGSLETQLVTTTGAVSNQQGTSVTVNQNHTNNSISNGGTISSQKHGVSNGGSDPLNNIILNSDSSKSISGGSFQSGSVLPPGVVNTVVASLQGGVHPSGYINQVTSSIGLVQSNVTNLSKQEGIKLVYPSNSQPITTSIGSNINIRGTYSNQNVTSLLNGNLGPGQVTPHTVLNSSTSNVHGIISHSYSQAGSNANKQVGSVGGLGMDQNKPTGTALVIKAGNHCSQSASLGPGVVPAPMTVNSTMTLTGTHVNTSIGTTTTGVPGVVTLTKPLHQSIGSTQTIVGGAPSIIPANVQILNVNTIRPGTQGQKGGLPQRVMIGAPQVVGGRPGQPGQITLQTLQGLQPGTQGHLLLKTENGQFQLLRVGPATTPTAAIAPNNAASNTAFRVQSVPAGAAPAGAIQAQMPALTTTTTTTPTAAPVQRVGGVDTTKEKCRKFLANLLELSSREPKAVERNVRTLIQELVDTKVEPEEFCDRLERLLNASPQPCLIGFLKKSLPLLRQSMVTKELVIEGIRPPPPNVVFSIQSAAPTVVQQSIQVNAAGQLRPQVQMSTTPQMRVIAHPGISQATNAAITRPNTPLQHRIVTPMRVQSPVGKVVSTCVGVVRSPSIMSGVGSTPPRIAAPLRLATPLIRATAQPTVTMRPSQPFSKPSLTSPRPNLITSQFPKPQAPSLHYKTVTTAKEKEKKSFSSAGYTGDDDINDVAAMGGVNLAEETQRILGSTEYVGTQIRSCKDDIYLHSSPLLNKIRQIATRHGLDEPSSDVAALVSHAAQERLKNIVEKLAVLAEHRIDLNKSDSRYDVTQDVRGQLKFLEELDRVERKRHEEQERELLLRAAKSRSKSEDPEQAKLKAKAKEMQRAEMEELRQREANLTALQAIGPRKKPKLDSPEAGSSPGQVVTGSVSNTSSNNSRSQIGPRPRVKRVIMRDLLLLLEEEKESCRRTLTYRAYLK